MTDLLDERIDPTTNYGLDLSSQSGVHFIRGANTKVSAIPSSDLFTKITVSLVRQNRLRWSDYTPGAPANQSDDGIADTLVLAPRIKCTPLCDDKSNP